MLDEDLIFQASRMYYLDQRNFSSISQALGVSRQTVARMIRRAVDSGMVQVQVVSAAQNVAALGQELKSRFGLDGAVVVSTVGAAANGARKLVMQAGASYIVDQLRGDELIGLVWGSTLVALSESFPPNQSFPNIRMVQMNGSFSSVASHAGPERLMNNTRNALGAGDALVMNVPMYVDSTEVRDVLMSDSGVARLFEVAKSCDLAIFTAASASRTSDLYRSRILSAADVEELRREGAVGEIAGQYFDQDGRPCAASFRRRCMALSLEELSRIPERICVVTGMDRAAALSGALHGGYVSHLVVDDQLAAFILGGETNPTADAATT